MSIQEENGELFQKVIKIIRTDMEKERPLKRRGGYSKESIFGFAFTRAMDECNIPIESWLKWTEEVRPGFFQGAEKENIDEAADQRQKFGIERGLPDESDDANLRLQNYTEKRGLMKSSTNERGGESSEKSNSLFNMPKK